MAETDWLKLWGDLVQTNYQTKSELRLVRYQAHARKRTERPDPLLDFIVSLTGPQDSVIDIGPGSGRWSIPLARKVKSVTAVEPTSEMREILAENIRLAGLKNVTVILEAWEKVELARHDICVGAHAMYNAVDLAAFVKKMMACSRKICGLSIRLLPADGVMAELSETIYGRRHDSPDAIIAYNALYSLGIYANVLVEENIVNWVNNSFDEALLRAKRHLRVENESKYDDRIIAALRRRLVFSDGCYQWPDGMRSALLYWKPVKPQ